jgi:hypothetical protein
VFTKTPRPYVFPRQRLRSTSVVVRDALSVCSAAQEARTSASRSSASWHHPPVYMRAGRPMRPMLVVEPAGVLRQHQVEIRDVDARIVPIDNRDPDESGAPGEVRPRSSGQPGRWGQLRVRRCSRRSVSATRRHPPSTRAARPPRRSSRPGGRRSADRPWSRSAPAPSSLHRRGIATARSPTTDPRRRACRAERRQAGR